MLLRINSTFCLQTSAPVSNTNARRQYAEGPILFNRLRKNPDFCFAPGRLVGIIVASLLDSVEVAADAVPRYSGSSALQLHFSRAARAGGPPAAANPRDGKYRAPQDLARVR